MEERLRRIEQVNGWLLVGLIGMLALYVATGTILVAAWPRTVETVSPPGAEYGAPET